MLASVNNKMAVDVIAPDARKKVDELFLYWLSEPSTQDLLRQELARVCGLQQQKVDLIGAAYNHHHRSRPTSPTVRDVTPPPGLTSSPSRSPKSPSKKSGLLASQSAKSNCDAALLDTAVREEVDGGEPCAFPSVTTKTEAQTSNSPPLNDSPPATPTGVCIVNHKPVCIPPFYFPKGQPRASNESKTMQKVERVFQRYQHREVAKKDFHHVVKALGLPYYWKAPLFKACSSSGKGKKTVSLAGFKKAWTMVTDQCYDEASRFMSILLFNKKRDFLIEEDFETIIQDVVDCHPGLGFLRDAPEFHTRYVETVISRIFYSVDRSWKGRITVNDLRTSSLLQAIVELEKEDNINKVTDFFSYEHFYVVYCKFWELDTDHDLLITGEDLARHCDHALNEFIVDRLVSGVVTKDKTTPKGQMGYKDFVWFLLSEEDKTTARSVEYWFRVLDIDGDGILSLYELEYFYNEVLKRLEDMNIESLSLENTVCQLLDMINPKEPGKIVLGDLKRSKLTPQFLNTFINIEKYLDYEQRDPLPIKDDEDENSRVSDWERFAAEQYELLVAEEQCEEDEDEEDEQESNLSSTHEPMEAEVKDYLILPRTV